MQELPGGPLRWRTRVRLVAGRDGRAGLRAHLSHRVVPLTDCPITVAGRNLHTWTGYHPGLDPENIAGFAETFKGFGTPFSQDQLPQASQFVMRVNLTY